MLTADSSMETWAALQIDRYVGIAVVAITVVVSLLSPDVETSLFLAVLGMIAQMLCSAWGDWVGPDRIARVVPLAVIRMSLSTVVLTPLVWSCGPAVPAWIVAMPACFAGPLTTKVGRESVLVLILMVGILGGHALAGGSLASIVIGATSLGSAALLSTRASRMLKQLIAEVQAANQAKSRFLANMSHELRTPLAGVIGLTHLALDTRLDDEPRQLVGTAKASAEHLLAILNDILDLSKIEADRMTLEVIAFDVEDVVQQVVSVVRASAHGKDLEIRVRIDSEGHRMRLGDPVRLRQVLLNLAGNAVKFSAAGVVDIAATAHGDRLRFSVKDQGIGISEEQQEQLFQPFVQADATTNRRFGGTGLGLSICRPLVAAMGGELSVVSRPGEGSTFSFDVLLPRAPAEVPLRAASLIPAERARPLRVLLAEDNLVNQLVVGKMLRRAGHDVRTVGDGDEALAALEEGGVFDVVLMDMQMPRRDGLDTARIIRAKGMVELPIIALTANAMSSDREACLGAGMDAFLVKPVSEAALNAALVEAAR